MKRTSILTLSFTIAACLAAVTSLSASPILITEVLYDASGTDAPGVFTEIYGLPGTHLDGFSLVGVNGSTGTPYRTIDLTGGVVPVDGIFVVATASAAPPLAAVRDFVANVDWQNGPDAVQLRDTLGGLVDALQYGDAGARNAGEGHPVPDVDAGLSLTRDASFSDSNDNAADFSAARPTPGTGGDGLSERNVPEPTTLGLFWLGGACAWFRRRASRYSGRNPKRRTTPGPD